MANLLKYWPFFYFAICIFFFSVVPCLDSVAIFSLLYSKLPRSCCIFFFLLWSNSHLTWCHLQTYWLLFGYSCALEPNEYRLYWWLLSLGHFRNRNSESSQRKYQLIPEWDAGNSIFEYWWILCQLHNVCFCSICIFMPVCILISRKAFPSAKIDYTYKAFSNYKNFPLKTICNKCLFRVKWDVAE